MHTFFFGHTNLRRRKEISGEYEVGCMKKYFILEPTVWEINFGPYILGI